MNGNSGIVPTVDLATNNNGGFAYPYPVMSGFGGGGFGGFGSDGAIWLIVLLALIWGNNGNGNGGFFGNNGFDNGYAWLSNGQKDIMNNTTDGFNSLHLSNQIEGTRDGIYSLSNQLCNSTSDITSAISNGFYSSEIAANNRAVNQMQDTFALSRQFADCCCENRLGIANLTSTVISENCADREALSNGIRDIISSQTANTQRILDQLCNDKIDAKNEKIADLQREILMKDLQASQTAQTATLRLGQEAEVDALYNRLSNCPVPTVPVYGRQPIFTCNNGCGCSGNSLYGTSF
ncbi:MAG: hypothetical protein IJI98_08175 [Methanosphaera sp.]|nr:hypothetical protein [Methanosphaera sp.]